MTTVFLMIDSSLLLKFSEMTILPFCGQTKLGLGYYTVTGILEIWTNRLKVFFGSSPFFSHFNNRMFERGFFLLDILDLACFEEKSTKNQGFEEECIPISYNSNVKQKGYAHCFL